MNGKRAKALRQLVAGQQWSKPDGLTYKPTQKVIGRIIPQGWNRTNLFKLLTTGGPWSNEALAQIKPRYAMQAINTPDSQRAAYRLVKRELKCLAAC